MKKFIEEFKGFIARGNVIDMAVGVIIGGAFGKIVSSLVEDIIMPPISMLLSGVDIQNMFFSLDGKKYASLAEAKEAAAPVFAYGNFLQTVINFLIIAFVIFVVIKQMARFKSKKEVENSEQASKTCPYCKSQINLEATRCPHCTSEL